MVNFVSFIPKVVHPPNDEVGKVEVLSGLDTIQHQSNNCLSVVPITYGRVDIFAND